MPRKAPGIIQHFRCPVCKKTYTHIADVRITSSLCPTQPHKYPDGKVMRDSKLVCNGMVWMEEVAAPDEERGVRYVARRSIS